MRASPFWVAAGVCAVVWIGVAAAQGQGEGNAVPVYEEVRGKLGAAEDQPDVDAPLDGNTERFILEQAGAYDLIHRAAGMPVANWPADEGVKRVHDDMSKLSALRRMADMLVLRARYFDSKGNHEAAARDLLAGFAVGRHAGQGKLLVSKLTELGITSRCTKHTAVMLHGWPADLKRDFEKRLGELPAPTSWEALIGAEQEFSKLMISESQLDQQIISQAMSPLYDAAIENWRKPATEYEAALNKAVMQIGTKNPIAGQLAKTLVASLAQAHLTVHQIELEAYMLQVALRISADGREAGEAMMDPCGDGPLEYRELAHGFVISSQFEVRGKRVELVVGR